MMSFQKVKAPRSFGSHFVADEDHPWGVPVHELIDGKWVETPEYKEMMKK